MGYDHKRATAVSTAPVHKGLSTWSGTDTSSSLYTYDFEQQETASASSQLLLPGRHGYDHQRALSLVQVFDKNQDGSLDKTEFMHLWAGIFG